MTDLHGVADAALDLTRVRLDPGDTIVVRLRQAASVAAVERIERMVRATLPSHTGPILVLDQGMSIEILATPPQRERGTIVRFDRTVLEEMLFGFAASPVRVRDVRYSLPRDGFEIEIEGEGVPDVPEVRAICTVNSNRAGQRLHTMTFEPAR